MTSNPIGTTTTTLTRQSNGFTAVLQNTGAGTWLPIVFLAGLIVAARSLAWKSRPQA